MMVRLLQTGINDLKTLFPEIAAEACGWNPSEFLSATKDKKMWICHNGHTWMATINHRTSSKTKCPYCAGKLAISGVNDLATLFPELAKEANGWDPRFYLPQSNKKVKWRCEAGHIWTAQIYMRSSHGTGCPTCSGRCYSKDKQAWLYLLKKEDQQKIGITNNLKSRLRAHKARGWKTLSIIGPLDGAMAWSMESRIKAWLREKGLLIKGTHENWRRSCLDVASLNQLFMTASVDTAFTRR